MNPKSSLHSCAPRRGQALILAVLVMLFAVLLSSAFLVVIGNTGRQIGRETDRSEASRNADKAVSFVVAKMRASSNPDIWNPGKDAAFGTGPTNTTEAEIYYSQLDKAMGWADQGYAKYPNPLTSRQAPQFLVRSDLVTDDAEGGDKRFMLKITVIGLSSKNPETWSRRTLYKTTNWNGATFSYANFVTSFDPDTQKTISSALVQAPTVGTPSDSINVDVYASKGQGNEHLNYSSRIAEVGNTLMISDGKIEPLVGVVSSAQASTIANVNGYRLQLRVLKGLAGATSFVQNAKVSLVGSLFESPLLLDEDGNQGVTPQGTVQPQQVVSVNATPNPYPMTTPQPLGNGSQFNGGISVPERVIFAARPPLNYNSTLIGQNALSSSGPISINTQLTVADATSQVQPGVAPTPIASENQFFRASYSSNASGTVPTFQYANSLVAPVIAPRAVRPAPIDLASYRNKANTSGLYIPNPDDVEKFNGQPLSTSQLQRFWQRKSFPVASGGNVTPISLDPAGTTGARLCYGRPGVDKYLYPMASGSLEQRGIRGWISPWEFLPRGAQIILNGTTITVILDPLSDSSTNSNLWKDSSGVDTRCARLQIDTVTGIRSIGAQGQPAVVTTTAPFQGILSAEGNVRVSGTWTSTTPLTIVSGNNIYIEGNLMTPVVNPPMGQPYIGKIALLAKKNVVLNPTQFVSRPSGTVDTSVGKSTFVGTAQSGGVHLSNTNSFKIGDKVAVFAGPTVPPSAPLPPAKSRGWHIVTRISATDLTLSPALNVAPTTDFPDNRPIKVKLACDPPIVLLAKANRTVGGAKNPIPATEHFVPATTGGTEEANTTEEYTPATLPAGTPATDVFWAYKFAVGGDTFVRNVPFNNSKGASVPVAVAFDQAAQKSVVKFTVRGGDDKDPMVPDATKEDDGSRQLSVRPSAPTKIDLLLKPQFGAIKGQSTFDLQDLDQDGSPDTAGDTAITLDALNSFFVGKAADADREKSRWRVEDIRDGMNALTVTGRLTTRRLAQGDMTFSVPANSKQDNGEEAPHEPTKFRVPLTSSVVLFSGTMALNNVAPEDTTPIYQVGSAFGFRGAAISPTTDEDPNSIKASFYGATPAWNLPADTSTDNSVTYTTKPATSNEFAFTRDGSGDYDDRLPIYYVSALRFQRVLSSASIAPAPSDATVSDRNIKTNMTVEVDATIYAEGGSWFVIPVPTPNANNAQIANADQQIEWRRPAYAVTINGNIAQMMTPTATVDYDDEPDPDGVFVGAMKRWTDSLSYQVYDSTTPTQPKWRTIRYQAAPLPALDSSKTTGFADLPQLPASTDILYTYSN